MAATLVCISVDPLQITLTESVGGKLVGLSVERDNRQLSNVYLGRVANVLPGMDAAFVDIGAQRNALIYFADTLAVKSKERIEDALYAGDEIIVQITRPAVRNKGARVSQHLSLAGRYLVLMAGSENIGVSKRIHSKEERNRLRRIMNTLRPLDYGIIVRTEAEGMSESQLATDISELQKRFSTIAASAATGNTPRSLYREMGTMSRFVRDRLNESISAVLIDDYEEFLGLQKLTQQIAPSFVDRIKYYDSDEPIFARYGLEKDIVLVNEHVVPLSSGGYLTFDETEALTAIDVNTGRFIGKNRLEDTVLATNLEAVSEAARQLQLRNIGGIVVIDFIDMDNTRDRVKVMNALEAALKHDRTRTRIVQLSPLGLVEMTRRREGESLRQILHSACPYCEGDGVIKSALTVSIETRHLIRQTLAQNPSGAPNACSVTVHPDVALLLIEASSEALHDIEREFSTVIFLYADTMLHREASQISISSPHQPSLPTSMKVGAHVTVSHVNVLSFRVFIIDKIIVFSEEEKSFSSSGSNSDVLDLEIVERNSLFARARVLARHP